MAVTVITNGYFSINAVVLSDHCKKISLDIKKDTPEVSAMGNTEHRFVAGLNDWSLEVSLYQDFAAASVDATLWALLTAGAVAMEVRPDAGAASATNPKYTGTVVFEGYSPIDADHGGVPMVTAKFKPASALTRATS